MNVDNNVVVGYVYHAGTWLKWNESIEMRWEMKCHKCNNNDDEYVLNSI